MLPIILAGLLMVSLFVGLRLLRQSRWYQHQQLFRQLCRLHGLDRWSRRFLRDLAGQLRVPFAAWLFVDPRCLAAAQKLPGVPVGRLLQLQKKLFQESPGPLSPREEPEHALPKSPCPMSGPSKVPPSVAETTPGG